MANDEDAEHAHEEGNCWQSVDVVGNVPYHGNFSTSQNVSSPAVHTRNAIFAYSSCIDLL